MTINEFFGRRIKEARRLRGWTIERLAFESGVNKNYISDLERGKRNPTLKVADALSQALRIPIHVLLEPRIK